MIIILIYISYITNQMKPEIIPLYILRLILNSSRPTLKPNLPRLWGVMVFFYSVSFYFLV